MAMSSGNDSGGVMADINVTPLVDVMLVLLIIFMITTPLMNHKTKVELPRAELTPEVKRADEARNKGASPITISVTESGELFWNDEPISRELIESRLSSEAQKQPQPPRPHRHLANRPGWRRSPHWQRARHFQRCWPPTCIWPAMPHCACCCAPGSRWYCSAPVGCC